MPIYEYHCSACGKDFELLVRGETRLACPGCDGREIERRISLPGRPAGGGGGASAMDFSRLGPPGSGGGGCGGGGCGCH